MDYGSLEKSLVTLEKALEPRQRQILDAANRHQGNLQAALMEVYEALKADGIDRPHDLGEYQLMAYATRASDKIAGAGAVDKAGNLVKVSEHSFSPDKIDVGVHKSKLDKEAEFITSSIGGFLRKFDDKLSEPSKINLRKALRSFDYHPPEVFEHMAAHATHADPKKSTLFVEMIKKQRKAVKSAQIAESVELALAEPGSDWRSLTIVGPGISR